VHANAQGRAGKRKSNEPTRYAQQHGFHQALPQDSGAHPDFRTISFGRHISAATKAREASPTTGLPAILTSFIVERLGLDFTPDLERMLRVVSEAGERLIAGDEQPNAGQITAAAGVLHDPAERGAARLSQRVAGVLPHVLRQTHAAGEQ